MSSNRDAGRPATGARPTSRDVRIWALRVNKGKRATTYSVRWAVAGQEHHDTLKHRAQADGFRAELLTYAQKGTPFDTATGLPVPLLRERQARPWFEHACRYVDLDCRRRYGAGRRSRNAEPGVQVRLCLADAARVPRRWTRLIPVRPHGRHAPALLGLHDRREPGKSRFFR